MLQMLSTQRLASVSAVTFLLSFFTVGIIGVEILTRSFQAEVSERLGASAFLYLLCVIGSIISTILYAESSRRFLRATNWSTSLLGGGVAAGAFCIPVFAGYAILSFGFSVALALVLPVLTGLLCPLLSARVQLLPTEADRAALGLNGPAKPPSPCHIDGSTDRLVRHRRAKARTVQSWHMTDGVAFGATWSAI